MSKSAKVVLASMRRSLDRRAGHSAREKAILRARRGGELVDQERAGRRAPSFLAASIRKISSRAVEAGYSPPPVTFSSSESGCCSRVNSMAKPSSM